MESLFEKFKKYAEEEHGIEDCSEYTKPEVDKTMDELHEFLYPLASFLDYEWEKRGLDKEVWFVEDVDENEGKYNSIVAKRTFRIENETFEITLSEHECRWGKVSESEEDFNNSFEDFLRRTKRRLDLLKKYLKENEQINPSNRYH